MLEEAKKKLKYNERQNYIRNFSDYFPVAEKTVSSENTELSHEDRWDIYSEDSQKEIKLAERLEMRKQRKKSIRQDFNQKF